MYYLFAVRIEKVGKAGMVMKRGKVSNGNIRYRCVRQLYWVSPLV